jgi:DNA-binding NtrC family response regulator
MRLLLVEDKDSFRRTLLKALEGSGWEAIEAATPDKALEVLESGPTEAMVTDMRMPGFSGLELIKKAKRISPAIKIILISAFAEPKDIVEAISSGADDFIPKPFDLDFFLGRLEKIRASILSPPPDPSEPWVAASKDMLAVEKKLRAVADTGLPVLFCGQAGTGRARAARRLHVLRNAIAPFYSAFARDLGPNSFSEALLKSLEGGSALLIDLESLPAAALQMLLGCLERHPGVCWMGTCKDSSDLPEPLKSRIGIIDLALAPLAQRKDDILPIFHSHLIDICKKAGRAAPAVDRQIEKGLLAREWSGNVLELVWATAEVARVCTCGAILELPSQLSQMNQSMLLPKPKKDKLANMLQEISHSAEKRLLEEALLEANGDPSIAAKNLGLATKNYVHKLRVYDISLKND